MKFGRATIIALGLLFAGTLTASSLCTSAQLTDNSVSNPYQAACVPTTLDWGSIGNATTNGTFNTAGTQPSSVSAGGVTVSLGPSSGGTNLTRVDNSEYYYDTDQTCNPAIHGHQICTTVGWTPSATNQNIQQYGGYFNAPDQTDSSSMPIYGDHLIASKSQSLTLSFSQAISELSLQVSVEALNGSQTVYGGIFSITMTAYQSTDATGTALGSSTTGNSTDGGTCAGLYNNPPTACRQDVGTGTTVGAAPFLGYSTLDSQGNLTADIGSVVITVENNASLVGSLLVDSLHFNTASYSADAPEPAGPLTLGGGLLALAFWKRRRG